MNSSNTIEKKDIEIFFPFSIVNELAHRESNAKRYYRPVLTLGKWFARRLGSVFRTIIIFAAKDSSYTDRSILSKREFFEIYLKEYDFSNYLICDPFVGGGTTLIEALRLGFNKIIVGDINPVAWFICKKEIEKVDLKLLQDQFDRLKSRLENRVMEYYKTQCDSCLNQAEVMYYFWIKEIHCEKCSSIISLFRSYLFVYDKKDNKKALYLCPNCGTIFKGEIHSLLKCPDCQILFDSKKYIARRGKYYCDVCGHSGKIVRLNTNHGKPKERLYAIEFYCEYCNKRGFKKAEPADTTLFHKSQKEFSRLQSTLPLPLEKIPIGEKTQELINHHFFSFTDMFNSRQLLSLGKIYAEILSIDDQNVKEFFILIFLATLEYSNLLCEYHRKNHYIYNLFRKHAFPATLNPVENNVWGTKYGTGTFKRFFSKTLKIKEYCQNPYEYYISENGDSKRKKMKRPIEGEITDSYHEMIENPHKNVYLYCSSSSEIKVPNKSIDLVITDPPFYDNVQYAELSDFYYVWLRLGLYENYTWFKPGLTPKKLEIVKNIKRGKTQKDYQTGLSKVFNEISRILKKGGLFIFTFHHKELEAWSSIITSLLENNFLIINIYPVKAEMETSTQIRGTLSIEYDIIFVCRERKEEIVDIEWEEFLKQIYNEIWEKIELARTRMNELSTEDTFVIKLGVTLKYYTKYYPRILGLEKKSSHTEILKLILSRIDEF